MELFKSIGAFKLVTLLFLLLLWLLLIKCILDGFTILLGQGIDPGVEPKINEEDIEEDGVEKD